MLKIGITLAVYNHLSYTQKALKELSGAIQNTRKAEVFCIILLDDGSSDGTSDWVKQNFPGVHLLMGDGQLWWSGGINKGSRYAIEELRCSHVLWWNNDIEMAENYLSVLLEKVVSAGDQIITGSKIKYKSKPDFIWSMGGYFDPKTGKQGMYGWNQKDGKNWNTPLEVNWFPGMGTLIPAAVFNKIGYCNEKDFPQYFGDSDFTYRAFKAGFKLVCDPQLVIYNDTSNTSDRHNNSFKRLWESLFDIKSLYNIQVDLKFIKYHGESPAAYLPLIKKYGSYIGGFFKWKLLKLIGIKRDE